jgi:ubiquitin carboxyl-terminal hydrolase 14
MDSRECIEQVEFKFGKQILKIDIDLQQPGLALKTQIYSLTAVPPDRIKIMGLKGGKTINDDTDLRKCGIEEIKRKGKRLMILGSASAIERASDEIVFVEDLPEEEQVGASLGASFRPGMQNLGNTCYMNSVVQCLSHVKELGDVLDHFGGDAASTSMANNNNNNNEGSVALTKAARDLFRELKQSKQVVIPFRFLSVMRQVFPQFADRDERSGVWFQQDAEECWSAIVNSIANACPKVREIFGIALETELKCVANGETRSESDVVNYLKCNISIEVNHLADGFKLQLNETREIGNEIFEGHSKISKLPSYLVAQIARMYFKVDIQQKAKILRSVTFSNSLDVYDFCSDEYKKVLDKGRKLRAKAIETNVDEIFGDSQDPDSYITGHYELISVLTHKGRSADSGHYTAWAKNFIIDQKTKKPVDSWTLFDDETTHEKKEEDILALKGGGDHHMGYMMVYRAIYVKDQWKKQNDGEEAMIVSSEV